MKTPPVLNPVSLEIVKLWERTLLTNPASLPWSAYIALAEEHTRRMPAADFIVGQLVAAVTALFLDPEVPKTERLALWQALNTLMFNVAEAGDSLGLLTSPTSPPKPGAQA